MKTQRLVRLLVVFVTLLFVISAACRNNETSSSIKPAPVIRIGIVYTEPHPVLQTIIEAFKARVKTSIPDAVFVEKHASGSKAQYPAVVRSVLNDGVDLIVPITTPMSLEAFRQARGKVPVLFLGVTDPVGAGLVASLDKPQYCTGVSDNPPMEGTIDLFQAFIPGGKSIGIPYDPKDQPAVVTARRAADIARSRGLTAELLPVTGEVEIPAAIRGLAARNDAIVIGMDNLFMKNAGIVARTALPQGKPLFAADDKSVEMGAVAGVGVDYADVGRLGGDLAEKILKQHVEPGNIPIVALSSGNFFVNQGAAKELRLQVPKEIKAQDVSAAGSK